MNAPLDKQAGERAKLEALQQVEENAPEGWNELALRWVRFVAVTMHEWTADDVWAAGLVKPPEPRALGAVLARLARQKHIVRVGYRPTSQPSRHSAPIAVWRLAR